MDVEAWLLEPGDPSVRFWALQDIKGKPQDDPAVLEAQEMVMGSPPVKAILDNQEPGRLVGRRAGHVSAQVHGDDTLAAHPRRARGEEDASDREGHRARLPVPEGLRPLPNRVARDGEGAGRALSRTAAASTETYSATSYTLGTSTTPGRGASSTSPLATTTVRTRGGGAGATR